MIWYALIAMGAMFASALAGEPSLKQDKIAQSETSVRHYTTQPIGSWPAKPPASADTPKESVDTSEAPAAAPICCLSPYSTLFVGGSYNYVSLKQTELPQYSGNLWGVVAEYQYRKQDGFYTALKGLWRQGATSGESGQNYLHECKADERFGYNFSFGPSRKGNIAFFTGLGYRFMEQKMQQPLLADVLLAYNNFYVPIGTFIDFTALTRYFCLTFGLCATWMPQIYPTVNIVPLGGARWILEYELVNGVLELPITFSSCKGFTVTVRPVFEYWKDGATIAVGTLCDALGLPASSYLFGGVNLEFGWRF